MKGWRARKGEGKYDCKKLQSEEEVKKMIFNMYE